jgi:hypothetical protein
MVDTGQQESFAAAPCAGMTDSTAVPTPACPEEASTDGKCFSDFYNKAIETSSSPTVQLQQPDDQGQVPTASAAHSQLPLTAAVAGPDSKEPQDPSAAVYRLKIVGIPAGELRLTKACLLAVQLLFLVVVPASTVISMCLMTSFMATSDSAAGMKSLQDVCCFDCNWYRGRLARQDCSAATAADC